MIGKTIADLAPGDYAELTRLVDDGDIAAFVDAVGDYNPVHSDAAYAATTPFKAPIAPGFIETEMIEGIPEKVRQKLLDQIPLKRFGRADEVARSVVYICSADGDYITGSELSINGGLLM